MNALREALSDMDRAENSDDVIAYDDAAFKICTLLSSAQREVLKQLLFQGPVWDGNVPSKAARDDLISLGFATRCCFMGEQGYTAATYRAFTIFKVSGDTPFQKKPGLPG